jgi:hypothetical protein
MYMHVRVNDVMLSRAQSSAKRLASPKQIYTRPGPGYRRRRHRFAYSSAADWAL